MPLHLVTGYAGREHITSSDHGSFNIAMMGNGAFVLDRGSKFSASIQTNSKVRVSDGDILFQGRHIRLKENTYEDVTFENGSQGMKRNDLIVVRYEKNSSTGVESATFRVIKGTSHASSPVDPEFIVGDITELGGSLVAEMPLYSVHFEGLTLTSLTKLFTTVDTLKTLEEEVKQKLDDEIEGIQGRVDEVLSSVAHIYTATTGTWQSESGCVSNTITVSALKSTDNVIVDLNLDGQTVANQISINDAWGSVFRIVANNGSIKLYATNAPSIALPIRIMVVGG